MFTAIVQYTPPHQTRHRQDRLVVSGGRCEFGISLCNTHSTTALTTIHRNDHVELHAPNVPDDGVGVVVVIGNE